MMPCSLLETYQRFTLTTFFHTLSELEGAECACSGTEKTLALSCVLSATGRTRTGGTAQGVTATPVLFMALHC